ncbi:type II toxin-antitoxin system RelE/ParE family toxin [uncultured Ramlibacter sp.]|uniref:type II toxin-antitoxin system RelE/ParE family toxin n=1 Tax=uncultured Ramlibacter sp. TaxID=260755 RepID=UPI00262180F8|nr:type II toxin-antitoxin system RelE/ParE family toxin [uncultured Ramlibacter sp.]
MNSYRVRFTPHAEADLLRLYDFLLEHDLDTAERALAVIGQALKLLEQFPFSCRKAGDGQHGPRLREMVIPFGAAGYVALFEIEDASTVTILAVRHQRENDYH